MVGLFVFAGGYHTHGRNHVVLHLIQHVANLRGLVLPVLAGKVWRW